MKKLVLGFFMGILFLSTLASCTQDEELEELFIDIETQQCCGEGEELPPPPPPPGDDILGG